MNATKRSFADEKATSLVEFALILPVLLIMTLGVIDIGRAFQTYIVLLGGARGWRLLAEHQPQRQCRRRPTSLSAAQSVGLTSADLTVTSTTITGSQVMRVRVQHNFHLLLGLMPQVDIPMTVSASMEDSRYRLGH